MRILTGIVIVATGLAVACGGRTDSAPYDTQPPPAEAPPVGVQPITAGDYEGIEKTVGAQYEALQKHVAARELPQAAEAAEKLALAFGEAERFWAQFKKNDAVKWSLDARTLATEAAGAATAGDAAKTARSATGIDASCKQCHTAYREADPQGGFRVTPAAFMP